MICTKCKKRDAEPGRKRCAVCREAVARKRQNYRAKQKAAGKCRFCVRKALPGTQRCKIHTFRHRDKKATPIPAGCCKRCRRGKAPKPGLCDGCKKVDADKRLALKLDVINHYGGLKCSCPKCPERHGTKLEFLTIDHPEGNGAEHRRTICAKIYWWLKKNNYPEGYRVMCFNCNTGRHIHGVVCPHMV